MKKIHIFAPQSHSNGCACVAEKMASHSFVTRHCEAVQRHDHSSIEYIYAADGMKLRTIHRPASSTALTDSIDYVGNLILKNGQPSMYLFDGGYATFNANGAVNGWHYYIQDYMGNNRMVVNKNGTNEQITHYYPYGGVIGDISTNESVQKYKLFHYIPREQARSEGKELDRTFGLDNYDIHARQYFAMMPSWDRIDPLAEKYYGITPYAYCGGDPVNSVDMKGDSVCVLSAPSGAHGFGHMAILVQNKDGAWALYSKNGTSLGTWGFNSWDKNGDDKGTRTWDSPEAFLSDSDVNVDEDGNAKYTQGFTISCDKSDDAAAKDAAIKEIDEYYSFIGNNCAVAVQKALDAIKSKNVDNGSTNSEGEKSIVPNTIFKNIRDNNEGMTTILLNPIEIKK